MRDQDKGGKGLIDSIVELIDLFATYVRQHIKNIVDEGVAKPIQIAGRKAALFLFAFSLFSLAAIFIAVGLFLSLVHFIGYPLSYLLIGAILVIVGVVALMQIKR